MSMMPSYWFAPQSQQYQQQWRQEQQPVQQPSPYMPMLPTLPMPMPRQPTIPPQGQRPMPQQRFGAPPPRPQAPQQTTGGAGGGRNPGYTDPWAGQMGSHRLAGIPLPSQSQGQPPPQATAYRPAPAPSTPMPYTPTRHDGIGTNVQPGGMIGGQQYQQVGNQYRPMNYQPAPKMSPMATNPYYIPMPNFGAWNM